jgi:hypothetical protein
MGARPLRVLGRTRGTCFLFLPSASFRGPSRVHVSHHQLRDDWTLALGAMHRRLTCLETVARARHQRLAICSSAPKARPDCRSLARGG